MRPVPENVLPDPQVSDLLRRMARDQMITFRGKERTPGLRRYGREALAILTVLAQQEDNP